MTKHIVFVTGNSQKFQEVSRWVSMLDQSIKLEQLDLDIAEYQSLDVEYIAKEKAKIAWAFVQKPLIIDDGGIYLEKYNCFPGPLSKYVFQGIGLEGIWQLAQDDPRAYFLSCIVYIQETDVYHSFEGRSHGRLIKPEKEVTNMQMPFTEVFIPNGAHKTFEQLRHTKEAETYHHRFDAAKKLVAWLKNNN